MNKKSLTLGLIGKDVSMSASDKIHTFILGAFGIECHYEKWSVPLHEFDMVMQRCLGDLDGFNVTIPYKRDVFSYLDEIVDDAFACGAVNTIRTATRTGYNTDGKGFLLMLEAADVPIENKRVLVLGAGGSGRSVAYALKTAGAKVSMYRRNQEELQEACVQLGVRAETNVNAGGYDILINCTGVGMHDTQGQSPVTAQAFAGAQWAVDLIYVPACSEFLRIAQSQGLQTLNGAAMLFYQAYFADCIYIDKTPCAQEAKALYERYLQTIEE